MVVNFGKVKEYLEEVRDTLRANWINHLSFLPKWS